VTSRAAPALPVLSPDLVGTEAGPVVHEIDARWLMAYAAGIGETDPRWYDTTLPGGPPGHPLFPVCYEWPAIVALRSPALPAAVASRGVHLAHRVVVERPPRAGDRLTTTARVVALVPRRAGALLVLALPTLDAAGRPVTTTYHASLFRDVPVAAPADPEEVVATLLAEAPAGPPRWEETVDVAPGAAHVYTESARIWNPIHTDVAVARAAGLPGVILHGTATLALACSRVIRRDLAGDPRGVREIRARFTGMVPVPARLAVRGVGRPALGFEVHEPTAGRVALGTVVTA